MPKRKRRPLPPVPYFHDQPRRCDTNKVGFNGECLACGADQGVHCRRTLTDIIWDELYRQCGAFDATMAMIPQARRKEGDNGFRYSGRLDIDALAAVIKKELGK